MTYRVCGMRPTWSPHDPETDTYWPDGLTDEPAEFCMRAVDSDGVDFYIAYSSSQIQRQAATRGCFAPYACAAILGPVEKS